MMETKFMLRRIMERMSGYIPDYFSPPPPAQRSRGERAASAMNRIAWILVGVWMIGYVTACILYGYDHRGISPYWPAITAITSILPFCNLIGGGIGFAGACLRNNWAAVAFGVNVLLSLMSPSFAYT